MKLKSFKDNDSHRGTRNPIHILGWYVFGLHSYCNFPLLRIWIPYDPRVWEIKLFSMNVSVWYHMYSGFPTNYIGSLQKKKTKKNEIILKASKTKIKRKYQKYIAGRLSERY